MSDQDDTRITLRLPKELHEQLVRLARGDKRPPSSLNATIVFVLRAGLDALEQDEKSGNWTPELMAA